MQETTIKILEVTLKSDASITPAERNRILKLLRNGTLAAPAESGTGHEARIYSRAEAAKLLGDKTTRFIDLLARRGLLK